MMYLMPAAETPSRAAILSLLIVGGGLAQASSASSASEQQPQTPNLKEILLGRCYSLPPTGDDADRDNCLPLVSRLMGAFEGKNDADITTDDYKDYFSNADFSTEPDTALFWPAAGGDQQQYRTFGSLVTPEATPGGSLLDGTTFCGADAKANCPFGDFNEQYGVWTGAQASFWSGVYSTFASEVSGKIRIVTTDDSPVPIDPDDEEAPQTVKLGREALFLTEALPSLDADRISDAEIYLDGTTTTCDSSGSVAEIKAALEAHGIVSAVTCVGDASLLYYEEIVDEKPESVIPGFIVATDGSGHCCRAFAFFVMAVCIGVVIFIVVKNVHMFGGYARVPEVEQHQRKEDEQL